MNGVLSIWATFFGYQWAIKIAIFLDLIGFRPLKASTPFLDKTQGASTYDSVSGPSGPMIPKSFVLQSFHRCCSRRRRSFPLSHVLTAVMGILISRRKIGFAGLRLASFKHPFEKRPAPATASSRPVAPRQLRGAAGLFEPYEIGHFAFGHMKAQT